MMNLLRNNISQKAFQPKNVNVRLLWEYVNMMFNKPDEKRIEEVGPDRACAEWVLRNGGRVVWADGRSVDDYNLLPSIDKKPKLLEINGSDSSISHYGFPHLAGCSMLKRVILHNDSYIDDRAMKGLHHGKSTISHLQVSQCANVTDAGLNEIKILEKLDTLVLFDLNSVKDLEACKKQLQSQFPNCKISDEVKEKMKL